MVAVAALALGSHFNLKEGHKQEEAHLLKGGVVHAVAVGHGARLLSQTPNTLTQCKKQGETHLLKGGVVHAVAVRHGALLLGRRCRRRLVGRRGLAAHRESDARLDECAHARRLLPCQGHYLQRRQTLCPELSGDGGI